MLLVVGIFQGDQIITPQIRGAVDEFVITRVGEYLVLVLDKFGDYC